MVTQDLLFFFFFLRFILFILVALGLWWCTGFSNCSEWASHCCGLVAERGLRAPGLQLLLHVSSVVEVCRLWGSGSVVVTPGLSYPAACGIVPEQGWNPCPLHWQVDSQPLDHQGSPGFTLNNFPVYRIAVAMLYTWHSQYFTYNWNLVPFDHCHVIPPSPWPHLVITNLISFLMSLVFVLFGLDLACK